jgi:hypothetical protein
MGKIRIPLFISIIVVLFLNEASWASEQIIIDSQAPQYVGKDVSVKGIVANVHVSKNGNIFLTSAGLILTKLLLPWYLLLIPRNLKTLRCMRVKL